MSLYIFIVFTPCRDTCLVQVLGCGCTAPRKKILLGREEICNRQWVWHGSTGGSGTEMVIGLHIAACFANVSTIFCSTTLI